MRHLRFLAVGLLGACGFAWTLACLFVCAVGPFIAVAGLIRGCT